MKCMHIIPYLCFEKYYGESHSPRMNAFSVWQQNNKHKICCASALQPGNNPSAKLFHRDGWCLMLPEIIKRRKNSGAVRELLQPQRKTERKEDISSYTGLVLSLCVATVTSYNSVLNPTSVSPGGAPQTQAHFPRYIDSRVHAVTISRYI